MRQAIRAASASRVISRNPGEFSRLALTMRAVVRCPLTEHNLFDRSLAIDARFSAAAVYGKGLLKISWFAVAADEVSQCRATRADCVVEDVLDACCKRFEALS